jgi:spermidine/putrescine transport system permease protein
MDPLLEEAAADLGATPWKTFWRVTFPLLLPAVVSGALLAFTLSFDDFLITFFTAGVGSDTLPVRIYSMMRFGVTPEINAISSAVLFLTLAAVLTIFRLREE